MSQRSSRRAFLTTCLLTLGAAPGLRRAAGRPPAPEDRAQPRATSGAAAPPAPVEPTHALSLTGLHAQAARQRQALPEPLAHLGQMTRLTGVLREPEGEVLLLGACDPALPAIHIDDLLVALRNAYAMPGYQGVLGCTIDPWPDAKDPWRLQQVKVFGMPATVAMAARHVALDYRLKRAVTGLETFPDLPSLYDLARGTAPPCEGGRDKDDRVELTHRFWFYPLYPPAPRFTQEEGGVLIRQPVAVQLLTEQAFWNHSGQRTGGAPAAPPAERFAQLFTERLATPPFAPYGQLVQDFRVIEVAQLLRYLRIPAEHVPYFLQGYPLQEVAVPAAVGGIRREERGEVTCDHQVTERRLAQKTRFESTEQVHRYHIAARGGVEASVRLTPEAFATERSGALAPLRRRVRAARPSAQALFWPLGT